jgi:hypothetical protein
MSYPLPGGSVLVCCDVPTKSGYVRRYDQYTELIRSHLAQMWAAGQRRLALAIAYYEGGDSFALDSSGGHLATQDRANLIALIQDAIGVGFTDFLIEMIPEWTVDYNNWLKPEVVGAGNARPWQPLEYVDILEFTLDVDRAVAEACAPTSTPYWMDLLAECQNAEVGSRLWRDWCAMKAGPANALGCSMIPTQAFVDQIPKLYANGILPAVWNVHPYHPVEWATFKLMMKAAGYPQGFVVGETSDNDPAMAAAFAASPADLFWLYQWPFLTGTTPLGVTQDRLTLDYAAYQAVKL